MPQKRMFGVRRLLELLMMLGMALLAGAGVAAAHNELIGSDPPDGATVASGPARVVLTFDLPVTAGFSTVTVTGPDRAQWQAGKPVENGATVSAPLHPLGPAGQYTVAYQVLSADGHPVRGAIRFTLTTPGTGSAVGQNQPRAPASDPVSGSPRTGSGATAVWPWIVGGIVLLAAGAVVALRIARSS